MIPQMAMRGLIALTSAFTAKEAFVAKFELENPALLVTLPLSIIKYSVIPSVDLPQFNCPHRQKLHEKCNDVTQFDKLTVPPVNKVLDDMNIPLTKDAYKAIKQDLYHSKQMSTDDPRHKRISDYKQQATNQTLIASAFHEAGEKEGALMHTMLASSFSLKATLADRSSRLMDSVMKAPE
jgi:hypothetical protein